MKGSCAPLNLVRRCIQNDHKAAGSKMKELLKELAELEAGLKVAFFKEYIAPKAKELDPPDQDEVIFEVAKLLRPWGIKKNSLRAMIREKNPTSAPKSREPEPLAVFDGLVDLVEDDDGKPLFLLLPPDGLTLSEAATVKERLVRAPDRVTMPWLLPRAGAVLYSLQVDDDRRLFEDLVDYHRSASELPSQAHYSLLALYGMLTYMQESLTYMPIALFLRRAGAGQIEDRQGHYLCRLPGRSRDLGQGYTPYPLLR
jgi:hypothetical protein